jgi:hypothetical protein
MSIPIDCNCYCWEGDEDDNSVSTNAPYDVDFGDDCIKKAARLFEEMRAVTESDNEYDLTTLYLLLDNTSFCFGFCWHNFVEYFNAIEGYQLTTESLCDFIDDVDFMKRMLKNIYNLVEAHDRARVEYSKQDLHVAMLRIASTYTDDFELLKLIVDILFRMVRTCGAMIAMERFHGKIDDFACRLATLQSVSADTREYARDIRNSIIQFYTIRETAMAELCGGYEITEHEEKDSDDCRIISDQDERVLSLMEYIYNEENKCDNSGEWTDDDKSVDIADYCVKRRSDMNGKVIDVPRVKQETETNGKTKVVATAAASIGKKRKITCDSEIVERPFSVTKRNGRRRVSGCVRREGETTKIIQRSSARLGGVKRSKCA